MVVGFSVILVGLSKMVVGFSVMVVGFSGKVVGFSVMVVGFSGMVVGFSVILPIGFKVGLVGAIFSQMYSDGEAQFASFQSPLA